MTTTYSSARGTEPTARARALAREEAARQAALIRARWPRVRLAIELVPSTSSFQNLRALLPTPAWDRLRKKVYREAFDRCRICGDQGPRHPVECHEEWSYDEETQVQRLTALLALCPDCHSVKHYGRALAEHFAADAFRHLCHVNRWTPALADCYLEDAFRLWELRSRLAWTLDLSLLDELAEAPASVSPRHPLFGAEP